MWIEFYEDYYESHPSAMLDHVSSSDNVQFVTGDQDVDRLEKMIADGASDEEIEQELASWEGEDVDAPAPETQTEDEIFQGMESDLGFDDDYTR